MAKFLKAALIGLAALAASCAGPGSIEDAGRQVSAFHKQYNEGRYGALWAGTSEDMRDSTTERRFVGMLTAMRGKVGKVVSAEQVGWASNFRNGDSFVTIRMATTFERGSGEEEFVYRKTREGLNLAGYRTKWNTAPTESQPAPMSTDTTLA